MFLLAGCGGESDGNKSNKSIGVNVWLVAISDYTGEGDPNLATLMDRFRADFLKAGIEISQVVIWELTGATAERLTYVDMNSGDMKAILKMSSQSHDTYLNLFFVRAINDFGILGISATVNGPAENGTGQSGVLVNTLGGFTKMSRADLQMQGDTVAHEAGHYLGLWHTTEKYGTEFDPVDDTPECPVGENDTNGDGLVSSTECRNLDGPNLMFWQAARFPQDTISDTQSLALKHHPLVH